MTENELRTCPQSRRCLSGGQTGEVTARFSAFGGVFWTVLGSFGQNAVRTSARVRLAKNGPRRRPSVQDVRGALNAALKDIDPYRSRVSLSSKILLLIGRVSRTHERRPKASPRSGGPAWRPGRARNNERRPAAKPDAPYKSKTACVVARNRRAGLCIEQT